MREELGSVHEMALESGHSVAAVALEDAATSEGSEIQGAIPLPQEGDSTMHFPQGGDDAETYDNSLAMHHGADN